jgi:cobalt-zinc-cadmium efflux system outer membrane protein
LPFDASILVMLAFTNHGRVAMLPHSLKRHSATSFISRPFLPTLNMRRFLVAALSAIFVAGCRTPRNPQTSFSAPQVRHAPERDLAEAKAKFSHTERERGVSATSAHIPVTSNQAGPTQQISHEEEVAAQHDHSDSMLPPVAASTEAKTLSLQELEGLAISNNPTLIQATAQLQAENGAAYQAGLLINPLVGYTSEQIGVNGTAGETQGGYVQQEFVTGGKLRLSRAKYAQRAQIAMTNAYAQQQRVLNDLRTHYYRTLAAQSVLDIHRELVANAEDNLQTHGEMVNLGQVSPSSVLQAEVELRRDQLNLKDAENELQQAWRLLAAQTGVAYLAPARLDANPVSTEQPLDYDAALATLLANSPELIAARQKICHDEIAVARERVQPIPNVIAQLVVGRNFESGGTTAGVNVGVPLPIYDQNRGTIQQAQADLSRAHAEARRLELELQTRLAVEYRKYLSAWQRIQEYQATILPKAQEAADLLNQSYEQRRAPWTDVLAARRFQRTLNIDYVSSQQMYRESDIAIHGMLLTGGLSEPAAAVSGGHIDATPKPR